MADWYWEAATVQEQSAYADRDGSLAKPWVLSPSRLGINAGAMDPSAMSPGDTLWILDTHDWYYYDVRFHTSTLADNITIRGDFPDRPGTILGTDITGSDGLIIKNLTLLGYTIYRDCNDVELDNVTVTTGGVPAFYVGNTLSANNFHIHDCSFSGGTEGIQIFTQPGVSRSGWIIENNEIFDIGRNTDVPNGDNEGIGIQRLTDSVIRYNHIYNSDYGINIFESGTGASRDLEIHDNIIHDINNAWVNWPPRGIFFSGGTTVEGSLENISIHDNTIYNIGKEGIRLQSGPNGVGLEVYNNTIANVNTEVGTPNTEFITDSSGQWNIFNNTLQQSFGEEPEEEQESLMVSARLVGTNENISTYGDGTRDYTSLATWESDTDYDLVTAEVSEVLECYADSVSFTDSIDISGATTNDSYFRLIRPALGQGHNGTPNTGVKFASSSGTVTILITGENNVSIQDIVASINVNSVAATATFASVSSTNTRFVGCISADSVNVGVGAFFGFGFVSGTDSLCVDCLSLNTNGVTAGHGFSADFGGVSTGTLFYNCTSVGNSGDGFNSDTGLNHSAINCLAYDNTGDGFSGTLSGVALTNASDDATASGTGSRTNQTFRFIDEDNDDYHLDPQDAGARFKGTDLSSDLSFPFEDDIDGDIFTTWSIGFDHNGDLVSARRTAVNENVSTFGDGTRDYTSVSTWEAATDIDLVAAQQSEVLECYADSSEFDQIVSLAGATTNANYFRIVRAASGQKHNGIPNTGVKFVRTVGVNVVLSLEDYSSIQDIEASLTTSSAGSFVSTFRVISGGSNCSFVGCLAHDSINEGAGNGVSGFLLVNSDNTTLVDCIAINTDGDGFESRSTGSNPDAKYYNCNAINCGDNGFSDEIGDATVKNCLAHGNANIGFSGAFGGSNVTNASDDATAPGTGNRPNQTFSFINANNNNYHLSFNDVAARNFGADLSADPLFAFSDDIDGDMFGTWDIGFDEPGVNVGSRSIPLIGSEKRSIPSSSSDKRSIPASTSKTGPKSGMRVIPS